MTAKCVKRQKSLGVLVLTVLLTFMMEDKIETSTDFCSSAAIASQRKAKKKVFKFITEMKKIGPYCILLHSSLPVCKCLFYTQLVIKILLHKFLQMY